MAAAAPAAVGPRAGRHPARADRAATSRPAGLRGRRRCAPALRTRGFAGELRDLLLRAVERGVGRRAAHRPRASGTVAPTGSAAGTVLAAVPGRHGARASRRLRPGRADPGRRSGALAHDPRLLARERARRRHIFVDEYQDTDPAQIALLPCSPPAPTSSSSSATRTSRSTPSAGPTRGDAPRGRRLRRPAASCRRWRWRPRAGPACTCWPRTRRVAARLPGPVAQRALVAAPGLDPGRVDGGAAAVGHRGGGHVAGRLRRAHLETACPGRGWPCSSVPPRSSLAVLAPGADHRGRARPRLAVRTSRWPSSRRSPAAERAARAVVRPETLTDDVAEALLLGPIGGADACSCGGCAASCSDWRRPPAAGDGELVAPLLDDPRRSRCCRPGCEARWHGWDGSSPPAARPMQLPRPRAAPVPPGHLTRPPRTCSGRSGTPAGWPPLGAAQRSAAARSGRPPTATWTR